MRRHTKVLALIMGLLLLLVVPLAFVLTDRDGDGPTAPRGSERVEAVRADHLLAGLLEPAGDLDPHTATSASALLVLDQVYDTLVRPGGDLGPRPALASSWEVSDDGLIWTFELRDDVTLHDGSTLTSSDVVASLERIADVGREAHRLEVIEDLEAPDEHTIELTLERPAADLPSRLGASVRLAIAPAAALEADELGTAPVGSGPFRLDDPPPDGPLELERFEEHWAGPAPLERVTFSVLAPADAVADLRAGDLDLLAGVPAAERASVDAHEHLHLERRAGIEYWHLTFNLDRSPFDEPDVRRALGHALDRTPIAEAARPGSATPSQTAVPPGSVWHHDHAPIGHDRELARELLGQSGIDTLEVEVLVTEELDESVALAEEIATQLDAVGVDVEVRSEPLETLLDALAEGDFDAFVLGWGGELDPDALYYPFHHSEGERNYHGFADDEVDELLGRAREELEPARRKELYDRVVERVVDDGAYAYLYHPDLVRAWSVDLQGVELRPDGATRLGQARLDR